MVRGQVATIPNAGKVLLTTLSREQKNSFSILNPNDGVIYAKLNSAANISVTDWDWKLPSQSYGQYPGPWQSLGLYYQDLSGSGASAQVNLYESDAELAIPSIVAIGRAAQVAGTQVDITQGTIPQNPPQNTSRLWVDSSGHLHLLDSTGADKTVIDNTNFASYFNSSISSTALGGDLYGTIPNGHVWAHTNPIQLDRSVNVQWGTNTNMDRIVVWSDTNMYIDVTGACNIRPGGSTVLAVASGGITVTGTETVSGTALFSANVNVNGGMTVHNDIHTDRNNNSGVVYFGNSGSQYLYWDGSNWSLTGGGTLTISGNLRANEVYSGDQFQYNDGAYSFVSGGWIYLRSSSQGIVVQNTGGGNAQVNCGSVTTNGGVVTTGQVNFTDSNVAALRYGNGFRINSYDSNLYFFDASGNFRYRMDGSSQCDHYGNNGATNHRFFHFDGSWMGTQAANFQQQSDIRYKFDVVEVSDSDCLTRLRTQNIPIITWAPDNPMPDSPSLRDIGFAAQDIQHAVPETVTVDDEGNYFLSYPQLTAVLWGALRLIDQRLSKLEEHWHNTQPPVGSDTSPPSYTVVSAYVAP